MLDQRRKSFLKHLSKGRLYPIGVHFTHAGPDNIDAYRKVFKAPIRFEAKKNELVIAKEALDVGSQTNRS